MNTHTDKINLKLNDNTEITVNAAIEPIQHTAGNFHEQWDALANLHAAEPESQYSHSDFHDFLPPESVAVGECWDIKQNTVTRLLKQLHPNPSLQMRVEMYGIEEAKGLRACLRAYNNQLAHIVFRIHAEFALTDGWFTPSQFAGHLIIDRTQESVSYFQMGVPEGTLNFDVHWETILDDWDKPRWITDCGYCSRMELWTGSEKILNGVKYTQAISQEEAEHNLILQFYDSQKINWVSLEEALELAPKQQKPVHAISLDGPLTDEAC